VIRDKQRFPVVEDNFPLVAIIQRAFVKPISPYLNERELGAW